MMLSQNLKDSTESNESNLERRLQRACKHVNDYWFPPNPNLASRIRGGLEGGVYDLDIGFLISEIKTDFALLTYCLREIIKLLRKEDIAIPPNSTFQSIFELAGLRRIKQILAVPAETISSHQVENISEEQALRLQEALISASAAEVLSEGHNIDSDMGFSCALLRQLGHILIVWNYSSVYQRCLTAVRVNKDLDSLLTEALGFSPHLLALALINEWGLDGDLKSTLNPDLAAKGSAEQSNQLFKICAIGEALARANDPEHYPTAAADWESVKVDLENSLGIECIKLIQDRVRMNGENYSQVLPEMFKGLENINPDTQIHDHVESNLFRNNQFVKHCPPRLRKKFKDFYSILRPGQIVREAIAFLIKDIIPFAGFTGGYIYTFDPLQMQLIPRTQIGSMVSKPMTSVNYSTEKHSHDPVAEAFDCNIPIVQSQADDDITACASILAAVGNTSKIGVLYLELAEELLREQNQTSLLQFKAVRQALNDCLQG